MYTVDMTICRLGTHRIVVDGVQQFLGVDLAQPAIAKTVGGVPLLDRLGTHPRGESLEEDASWR